MHALQEIQGLAWMQRPILAREAKLAALGNAVPQLHVHVIARFKDKTACVARFYDAIQEHRDGAALGMVLALTATAIAILYTVNKLSAGPRDAR